MFADSARRRLGAGRLALGLAALVGPRSVVVALTPYGAAVPDQRIVRVLGLRQVVQGAAGLARPTPSVALLGAVVDLLHALSLVPVIALSPRFRASASVSAGLATTAALAGAAAS